VWLKIGIGAAHSQLSSQPQLSISSSSVLIRDSDLNSHKVGVSGMPHVQRGDSSPRCGRSFMLHNLITDRLRDRKISTIPRGHDQRLPCSTDHIQLRLEWCAVKTASTMLLYLLALLASLSAKLHWCLRNMVKPLSLVAGSPHSVHVPVCEILRHQASSLGPTTSNVTSQGLDPRQITANTKCVEHQPGAYHSLARRRYAQHGR